MRVERADLSKIAALMEVWPWSAGVSGAYILASSSTHFASTLSDYLRSYLTCHLVLSIACKHDSEQPGTARNHCYTLTSIRQPSQTKHVHINVRDALFCATCIIARY